MQNQINLVQGDTGPDMNVTLYDAASNAVLDVSDAGTEVRLHFRREGQVGTPSVVVIIAIKTNGGQDGVVSFVWPPAALDIVGFYEGEIEVEYSSGKIQTIPEKLRFYVREQIA